MATNGKHGSLKELVDVNNGIISREIFINEQIYQRELEQVFARVWLLVGHESQIRKPGDYFVSRMGEESVILARDREGEMHVFLNSCRHRGMKVCRYDEGNTPVFTCPYHGWSYATDGKLVGVPFFKQAYYEKLDKSKWGLVEVAQMCHYKGTIWATWDRDAPPLLEYLGDMKYYWDAVLDCRDGREGGSEVLGGVWKWRFPSNWKFGAENFLGDHYHAISHQSEVLTGIGPGGIGQQRHGRRRRGLLPQDQGTEGRYGNVAFTRLGHGSGGGPPLRQGTHYFPEFPHHPTIAAYFKQVAEERQRRLGDKLYAPGTVGTIFPNVSMHGWFPRGFVVWHPAGPFMTEAWRWYLVDADAPEEVKEHLRHYYLRFGGPTGMNESDDMENWNYATDASRGTIAKRYPYSYEMGLGVEEPVEGLQDAVFSPGINEENHRWYYRRWVELMEAASWAELFPVKKSRR